MQYTKKGLKKEMKYIQFDLKINTTKIYKRSSNKGYGYDLKQRKIKETKKKN